MPTIPLTKNNGQNEPMDKYSQQLEKYKPKASLNVNNEETNSVISKDKPVKHPSRPIFEVETLWPFELFTDRIKVYRNRIVVHSKTTFFHTLEFPILIEDIKTISVSTGLFLATIAFEISGYEQNPRNFNNVPKNKALEFRKIVVGLVALKKENIDTSKLSDNELITQAKRYGK